MLGCGGRHTTLGLGGQFARRCRGQIAEVQQLADAWHRMEID